MPAKRTPFCARNDGILVPLPALAPKSEPTSEPRLAGLEGFDARSEPSFEPGPSLGMREEP